MNGSHMRFFKTALSWFMMMASFLLCSVIELAHAADTITTLCAATQDTPVMSLTQSAIAKELGWVQTNNNRCGGFYLEPPFLDANMFVHNKLIITSDEGMYSSHGTSISQGKVTITQNGQQITANKAYVYRDPITEKYSAIDLIGNVELRQPNDLVRAKCAHIDLKEKTKSLNDILYRTAIYGNTTTKPPLIIENTFTEHEVTQLSAWGKAKEYKQDDPHISHFKQASYSTCPPLTNVWNVKASQIDLDKNTGRGIAWNARLYLKEVPIFYTPYFNFPIDSRRKTGFLRPIVGTSSTNGPSLAVPFYWNMAPNYDDTLTPLFLSKRGLQLDNSFRYLTLHSQGTFRVAALPNDPLFSDFKQSTLEQYGPSTDPATQSEVNTLEKDSDTRSLISWQNKNRINEHWNNNIDYSRVSDDYYLKDFNSGLHTFTPNQLLQQADTNYEGEHWQFTGRIQGYQTLHPVNQPSLQNQYMRLPQLVLNGDYPDEKTRLDYFVGNDLTRFNISNNPGEDQKMPIGTRYNLQPGISWPYFQPDFYITPRVQFAMTQYDLGNVPEETFKNQSRSVPIFDLNSGLYFDRSISLFHYHLRQTLEPRIYYTYVPYHPQNDLPLFDTTLTTLNYDQLFAYNRFSGLDRIGDANQVALGVSSRFFDQASGFLKGQASLGQIVYFKNRVVTLCSNDNPNFPCTDATLNNPQNEVNRSPLSGVLSYNLTPRWSIDSNTIWNSKTNQVDNESLSLHYSNETKHNASISYSYVRNGDPLTGEPTGSDLNNLSVTDFTTTWPIAYNWTTIGRWTESWNRSRFQNLFYGLQYDSCCWAIRFMAGRAFTNVTLDNTYQYNTQFFVQLALKGLGNIGTGNPSQVISGVVGNSLNTFGQDF
jgi:LPS-assembly protein